MEIHNVNLGPYDVEYELRRKVVPAFIGVSVSSLVLGGMYNISYENKERLWGLRDKGFVLLPNHQKWIDIPLEGILLKRKLGREGNYIMKGSLPNWLFEPMGGISIIRDKEMVTLTRKYSNIAQERQVRTLTEEYGKEKAIEIANGDKMKDLAKKYGKGKAIKAARDREDEIYGYEIPNLLARDEIIVTHIEGTRRSEERVEIGRANVKNIIKSQKAYGEQITFVPLDIKYEGKNVILKVGNPVKVPDGGIEELLEHLRNEVEKWD
tara:strand:+ start:811 stop:1608 length:798 start_codon:yes stop_codon:yes gene_type:complete